MARQKEQVTRVNDKEWDEVMKHIRDDNRVMLHKQLRERYIPVEYTETEDEFVLVGNKLYWKPF